MHSRRNGPPCASDNTPTTAIAAAAPCHVTTCHVTTTDHRVRPTPVAEPVPCPRSFARACCRLLRGGHVGLICLPYMSRFRGTRGRPVVTAPRAIAGKLAPWPPPPPRLADSGGGRLWLLMRARPRWVGAVEGLTSTVDGLMAGTARPGKFAVG